MNRQRSMERLQKALLERQRRLIKDEHGRVAINDAFHRNGSADPADAAAVQSEQEINCRLSERQWDELAEIETAIRKMQRGEYGFCEDCGCRIRRTRLQVLPSARFCLRCQEEQERRSEAEGDSGCWDDVMSWDESGGAMPEPLGFRAYSPGR